MHPLPLVRYRLFRWETHLKPRTMGWTNTEDIFGDVDGLIREQRGWLTEEVVSHKPLYIVISVSIPTEVYPSKISIRYSNEHFSGDDPAEGARRWSPSVVQTGRSILDQGTTTTTHELVTFLL